MQKSNSAKIIYLHHSTGNCVWQGGIPQWLADYNATNKTTYEIIEQAFPKKDPYGWNNYPFDYWNIWVNNAGDKPFKNEPTLEMLTKQYDTIVFKHCFPVANIVQDTGKPDVNSTIKSMENYKLQYEALKEKLYSFPQTRFVVWTGAALTKNQTTPQAAERAKIFFEWVKNSWDKKNDNIFIWDFWDIETDGGIYLKDEYAAKPTDSHPNDSFSRKAAPLFCQRLVNILEGNGDKTSLTGL